jgi:hypothetical protein
MPPRPHSTRLAPCVAGLAVALLLGCGDPAPDPAVEAEQHARHLADVRRVVDAYLAARRTLDAAAAGTPEHAQALQEAQRTSFWLLLQFPELRPTLDSERRIVVADAERLNGLVEGLAARRATERGAPAPP